MQVRGYTYKKRIIFLIFGFFFTINIISNGGHFDANDGIETFLVTESIVLKHTAKLDPTVPSVDALSFNIRPTMQALHSIQTGTSLKPDEPMKPMYSMRPLILSAIGVPLYMIADLLNISPIPVTAILTNSTILAFTSVIVFCFASELTKSRKVGFVASLIFGVTSFAWPYNTSLFPQPLESLFLIAATYFTYKSSLNKKRTHTVLGALFLGLSLNTHPTSFIFLPALLGYAILKLRNRKNIILFAVVLGFLILFLCCLNYIRFGSPFDFGYGTYGSLQVHSGWIGLLGLVFSPGAGLLFFFPIVILLPFAIKKMYSKDKILSILFAYVIVSAWLYFGTLSYGEPFAWSGAGGWGPRYLVPLTPFISVALAYLIMDSSRIMKVIVSSLSVIGFVVNLLGILTWYAYGYSYGWAVEALWKAENSMNVMTWVPQYSPIILHAKALITNYVGTIDISAYPTGYMRVGLYSCPVDSYLFCKFGLIPIIIGVILITILSYIILKNGRFIFPKKTLDQ